MGSSFGGLRVTGVFGSNFPDIVSYAVIRLLDIDLKVRKEPTAMKTLQSHKPEVQNGEWWGGV